MDGCHVDGSFAQRGLKCQEWFVPFLQFIEGLFRLSRISIEGLFRLSRISKWVG